MFAPALVQQRQQPVIEEIQERRTNATLLGLFVSQPLQVITGQWRVAAVQAEKCGLYPIPGVVAAIAVQVVGIRDIGCREAEPRMALQADTATTGRAQRHGLKVIFVQGMQQFQQTVERIVPCVGQQPVG
ncbi:hypothetical protein D3C80_1060180 [compost metagenome]